MEHLEDQQVARLEARLRQELGRLRDRQASEDATAAPEQELGDIQDKASEEVRRTTAFVRRSHHEARALEVEAALRRMEEGTYGICEETDEPIPFARLEAEPTTRYTVEALEILEDERQRGAAVSHEVDEREAY